MGHPIRCEQRRRNRKARNNKKEPHAGPAERQQPAMRCNDGSHRHTAQRIHFADIAHRPQWRRIRGFGRFARYKIYRHCPQQYGGDPRRDRRSVTLISHFGAEGKNLWLKFKVTQDMVNNAPIYAVGDSRIWLIKMQPLPPGAGRLACRGKVAEIQRDRGN